MDLDSRFWADKRVCVTGGTGFLGWHLVQQLLPIARHVRLLGLRPASKQLAAQLKARDCIFADVRDADAVRQAVRGCDIAFHTAGTVAVWGPALKQMRDIHVVGTQQVLDALPAGARLVHTSSVVAIGATKDGAILAEESPFTLQSLKVDYVHAKKAAEDLALEAAANGRDVVVVNPAYLLGPEDYDESIMGRFCLRFWRGKMPIIPPGSLNFVDVRDVARGHLLAAERGRRGCRYILAGENKSLYELANHLASVNDMSMRWRFCMPGWLQAALAGIAECRAMLVNREPYPSWQHVRMSRYQGHYSSARAQTELGYAARPLDETIADALRWLTEHGWLKSSAARKRQKDSAKKDVAA